MMLNRSSPAVRLATRALVRNLYSSPALRFAFQPAKQVAISGLRSGLKTQSNIRNQFRYYSVIEEEPNAKVVGYEEVKALSEKPGDALIVDVREPSEYAQGHIPNAVNIPYKTSPGALGLPDDDFEMTFGFPKPTTDTELVFYCLAGVRSTAAEELAGTFGYGKRLNYVGSWEDWANHEAETPKE
ncbi:unnamed protein product [Kuraishia capsulata CBS 1993]|uniref:Rhodanese domain-containing protein n=1 Tax=Kuraishia capsulata CBS 1993 TaxID=1382522 RepID=W6MU46_9ASCO|nr:uncharacterized protein KUCA_T00004852001 [Kuraishia capsulata CBS 1993]CDK28867.1 unnamed protein product [Kuraishia capsulata CBS 1993]